MTDSAWEDLSRTLRSSAPFKVLLQGLGDVVRLPVPAVELSTGTCKQIGNLTKTGISSIACSATDRNGKNYEVQFESDGSPTTVRRIVRSALVDEKRRTKQIEQLECRQKAEAANILPRDRTAYIIGCLEEDSQKPAANQ